MLFIVWLAHAICRAVLQFYFSTGWLQRQRRSALPPFSLDGTAPHQRHQALAHGRKRGNGHAVAVPPRAALFRGSARRRAIYSAALFHAESAGRKTAPP